MFFVSSVAVYFRRKRSWSRSGSPSRWCPPCLKTILPSTMMWSRGTSLYFQQLETFLNKLKSAALSAACGIILSVCCADDADWRTCFSFTGLQATKSLWMGKSALTLPHLTSWVCWTASVWRFVALWAQTWVFTFTHTTAAADCHVQFVFNAEYNLMNKNSSAGFDLVRVFNVYICRGCIYLIKNRNIVKDYYKLK